jgi:hypothetical protein
MVGIPPPIITAMANMRINGGRDIRASINLMMIDPSQPPK